MRTIVVRRNGVKQEVSVPIDAAPQVAAVSVPEPKAEGHRHASSRERSRRVTSFGEVANQTGQVKRGGFRGG